jgi:hypothetical protein
LGTFTAAAADNAVLSDRDIKVNNACVADAIVRQAHMDRKVNEMLVAHSSKPAVFGPFFRKGENDMNQGPGNTRYTGTGISNSKLVATQLITSEVWPLLYQICVVYTFRDRDVGSLKRRQV